MAGVQTLRTLLLSTLEDMLAEELKRFIFFLNDLPEGITPIGQGRLENKVREDIVQLLVNTYLEEGAVKVTLHALRKAHLNDLAKKLEENYNSLFPDVEDRCNWIKRVQDVSQAAAGASGSDDITERKGGSMSSRPGTLGAEQDPANHQESRAETELGGTQSDASFQEPNRKTKESIIRVQQKLKSYLKKKYANIFAGFGEEDHPVLLNDIYTVLYITEGGSGGVNNEHEVRQIETAFQRQASRETEIICSNIFKLSPDQENTIRTVLTKGIAGIGKTVSVQKFILDWAEGNANQDIDFIFTLPFRDLNLNKGEEFSLMELLQHYFPVLDFQNHFSPDEIKSFDQEVKVLFIFDGLDECRLALDFQKNKMLCDVTKRTSVEKLLTNLILGNLLQSAHIWITSRPAAAGQIPRKCFHRVTEVRGFNESQKEEYFRKRFRDQDLAGRVISHVKSSRSLHIMCHIPVLCWISAAVLETVFGGAVTKEIPKTLTEIYTHFLLIQIYLKKEKYDGTNETHSKNMSASDVEIILKLGHLAFLQLEKGNLIFYEEDLQKLEIDVTEASVYSGVCTQIFKKESGLYREKVYCFVHLSIQEYLAALFVFHSFVNENINLLRPVCMEDQEEDEENAGMLEEEYPHENQRMPLSDLYCSAVEKALQSENGHLDLFLRFLLGLSLESTQELLQDLLTQKGSSSILAGILRNRATPSGSKSDKSENNSTSQAIKKIIKRFRNLGIKSSLRKMVSLRKTGSASRESESLRKTGSASHVSESLRKTGSASRVRESPRKPEGASHARKIGSSSQNTVQYIKEKIRGEYAAERIMNLFHCLNELNESSLIEEMQTSLRSGALSEVTLEPGQCSALVYVLLMSEKVLDVFDLRMYNTSVAGQLRLLTMVKNCRRALLSSSSLPRESCEMVASALQSDSSPLVEVDLSNNDLGDSGVKLLCAELENPNCRLQTFRLSGCQVTKEGCATLASALSKNPSHLRELDLSYNHPEESGERALSARLEDPGCRLEILNVDHGGKIRLKTGLRKYACQLTLDPNTAHKELSLSEGNRRVTRSPEKQEPYPDDHPDRFDCYHQVLCREGLIGRCYWEVEWTERDGMSRGCTAVGVAYKGICRKGLDDDSFIGHSKDSWSLELNYLTHFYQHHGKNSPTVESDFGSRRVGVYLNWPAGTLSFYRISSDTLTHLHTFHTTFTEPVYPGFGVCRGTSVSLCMLG